ncbi:MAG: preprotein translocase subunit SecG [Actinomycetaceae bacterium]|nr:preprotein translocase subunit SecG [Actinomycetaceae bacterium]
MGVAIVICEVLLIITSLLLILSILLHKGKGGGISDMFGGGISTAMRSSGVAERNLNRITVGVALVWIIVIVALGLMVKFNVGEKEQTPATNNSVIQTPINIEPEGENPTPDAENPAPEGETPAAQ